MMSAYNSAHDQIKYQRKTLENAQPQWVKKQPPIQLGDDGQLML